MSVDGTLMKINSTISRFLDQNIRAFEDNLQTGELLSFRVIRHFSEMLFYLFVLINLSLYHQCFSSIFSVLQLETSREYLDLDGGSFTFS